jgi:uncharacterized membrane protein (UPF0127 family)
VGVEIADNPSTQQRGLMFRKALPEDEGMLFGMVLEVNAGYTRSHEVKPGQHVRVER